jgi:serine protease
MYDITVNVDYINVTINQVFSTITSKGRICYNGTGQLEGLGFTYSGENLVYEAGLLIGQNSS